VRECLSELGDAVTYHGVVKGMKKKELLFNNYIFCLPSKHPYGEGQPISILEAMANGCAIVTTDHGGIKDIVNEEYGVFAEKQSPKSLAEAISERLCQESVSLRSWQEANTKYRAHKFCERIERIVLSGLT